MPKYQFTCCQCIKLIHFPTCTGIRCGDSHCESGLVRCCLSKKYNDFRSTAVFQFHRGNSRFKHGSVIVHKIFHYFTLSLSTSQVYMSKERCWFSKINFFVEYFPHGINDFFPANFMSSTYRDKNNTFSRCTKKQSQLETFGHLCRGKRIQMPGHSDSEFSIILEHPP